MIARTLLHLAAKSSFLTAAAVIATTAVLAGNGRSMVLAVLLLHNETNREKKEYFWLRQREMRRGEAETTRGILKQEERIEKKYKKVEQHVCTLLFFSLLVAVVARVDISPVSLDKSFVSFLGLASYAAVPQCGADDMLGAL